MPDGRPVMRSDADLHRQPRQTHTLAVLELTPRAYQEISHKLTEAGYAHAFNDDGTIDMNGIGVQMEAMENARDDLVRDDERNREGDCAVCGAKFTHVPQCETLKRRLNAGDGANQRQVGGSHYGLSAFQHWDIVVMFNLDYFQGQITKYVMRWDKKNGVQDLEKAQHFLEKYIEEIKAGRITKGPTPKTLPHA